MPPLIPQAGAIVFRQGGRAPEFLLVRAKQDPRRWIFPKGHVEQGETTPQAALRELREEAGIVGELVGPVGSLTFPARDGIAKVDYYLTKFLEKADTGEGRDWQWCTFDDAIRQLSFDDAKDLLAKAKMLVDEAAGEADESR